MKHFITIVLLSIGINAFSQYNGSPAFDKSISLGMTYNTHSNSSVSINAGIHGNRLPVSLMVGAYYMEGDVKGSLGYNATAMWRLFEKDVINFNAYSTVYKQDKFLYEYGAKAGIYLNDQSVLYLSAGRTFDNKTANSGKTEGERFKTITMGASFSLLF